MNAAQNNIVFPIGTVTFLFTDIEGSTQLWELQPDSMRIALTRHDALLREAVEQNNGVVFKTTGDGVAAAFATAPDALQAALAAQQALLAEAWPPETLLRARMGLHTGTAEQRDGDYYGPVLNRAARLMAVGHGGQTLLSDVTQELCRDTLPNQVSLLLRGEHRLKDLTRAETIFQLAHPDLPAPDLFPPLRTLDSPDLPNNLPQQVTSFIGRETQIATVQELLNKTRLLTLVGSGGTGKTRLSLQVAADVLEPERFPDGVWLVELASLSDATLVPQAVTQVMGIREQPGQILTQALCDALKTKRLLILLDNCEHVIDACAPLIAALLRACPNVKILTTSREPLGVAGELTYRVPSLTLPDAKQTKTATAVSLSQFESVRLFIERAQFVKPDFAITNANAPSLAQLCYHLDGIPLAIELAAARVRSLTVEQINDKLDSRFRLLTGGDRSALPRQQTLRALIDWSYDLLSDNEKTLLARLSVFTGGWRQEAAETVCGFDPLEDWELLDLLTSLADKSLLLTEESDQSTRYRMLETVRQYATERLIANSEEAIQRERHLGFFLALAEEAKRQWESSEQVMWLNRLETEYDNLRAALDNSTALSALSALSGLRLAGALWRFWDVRGYATEGRAHLSRALTAWQESEPRTTDDASVKTAMANALSAAGSLAWSQSDYEAAQALLEKGLILYREIGESRGIATILLMQGHVFFRQGDYTASRLHFEESLPLYRETGDERSITHAMMGLGNIDYIQGDYPAAQSQYEKSLAFYREAGDERSIANTLSNLAVLTTIRGDYAAAWSQYEESLRLHRAMGNKRGTAYALNGLGMVAFNRGEYATAQSQYEESLRFQRESGDKYGIANALINLGNAIAYQGDYTAARLQFEECLALYRETGDERGVANTWMNLGNVAYSQGEYAAARARYREGLSLHRETGDKQYIADGLEGMAAAQARGEGDVRLASTLWGAASALRESLGLSLSPSNQAIVEERVAQARAEIGDASFAVAWSEGYALSWEQAMALALSE